MVAHLRLSNPMGGGGGGDVNRTGEWWWHMNKSGGGKQVILSEAYPPTYTLIFFHLWSQIVRCSGGWHGHKYGCAPPSGSLCWWPLEQVLKQQILLSVVKFATKCVIFPAVDMVFYQNPSEYLVFNGVDWPKNDKFELCEISVFSTDPKLDSRLAFFFYIDQRKWN